MLALIQLQEDKYQKIEKREEKRERERRRWKEAFFKMKGKGVGGGDGVYSIEKSLLLEMLS